VTEIYDLYQQGRSLLEQGDVAQALVPLEKAKRLAPDKASIRERLGIAYFRLQRYSEAETEFRALLELAPADDYGHYALGRCLEKRGRVREANGHYKLASSLRPGSEQYAARIRDFEPHTDP
jgi:Flp pilus assembly protein TadD